MRSIGRAGEFCRIREEIVVAAIAITLERSFGSEWWRHDHRRYAGDSEFSICMCTYSVLGAWGAPNCWKGPHFQISRVAELG